MEQRESRCYRPGKKNPLPNKQKRINWRGKRMCYNVWVVPGRIMAEAIHKASLQKGFTRRLLERLNDPVEPKPKTSWPHPVEILRDEFMEPRDMKDEDLLETARNFTWQRDEDPSQLAAALTGGMTVFGLERFLAHVFKTTQQFWTNLQKDYNEKTP